MPEDKKFNRVTGSSESACSQSSSSSCSVASLLSVDDVQDGVETVAQCEGSFRETDTHDNCSDLLCTGNAAEGHTTLDYREDDQGRQGGSSDVSEDCEPEDSGEVVSEEADVTGQGEGRVYVGTAGSVHIAQTLIEVDIRANERDNARVAAPQGCSVMQHVDRVVVAQHSTTLNIHVGDRPDLVQHVLIEQITDPALVHAVDKVLVARISWRTESDRKESAEPQGYTSSDAQTDEENHTCDRDATKFDEAWHKETSQREGLSHLCQDQTKEMEVKVARFVVKVQDVHDQLVAGVLQQLEAGKLEDVVRRLYTDFNVRLMAVDCGLGFLMDVPMAQWRQAKSQHVDIQKVLSDLLPGQRSQELDWGDLEICEPDREGNHADLQLGKPLSLQREPRSPCAKNMSLWQDFISLHFPERHSQTYTIPDSNGQSSLTTQVSQAQSLDDFNTESAHQRALFCLKKMAEAQTEVMVILGQPRLGDRSLHTPFTAADAHMFPCNSPPPTLTQSLVGWGKGDCSLLLVTRNYGLVVCQMKMMGVSHLRSFRQPEEKLDVFIRKVARQAMQQILLRERSVSWVVNQYAPGLAVRKTLGLPFVTSQEFVGAVSGDPTLLQELSYCLETNASAADIAEVCLFADHFSSSDQKQSDVTREALIRLKEWWVRRVAGSGPDSLMTSELYDLLLAWFCGHLMSVKLPCLSEPRLSLSVPEGASDDRCAHITLSRQQVNQLHSAPPRLFVSGPPGTGKTTLLLLAAMDWLDRRRDVTVVITWLKARPASYLLHNLLQQHVRRRTLAGKDVGTVNLEELKMEKDKHAKRALKRLRKVMSSREQLFLVADEAGPDRTLIFQTLCFNLCAHIPDLRLWAASTEYGHAPLGWQMEFLNIPVRSPPKMVGEISQDKEILTGKLHTYDRRAIPTNLHWPPHTTVRHEGEGHSKKTPHDCVQCGRELAACLQSLGVGVVDQSVVASMTSYDKSSHAASSGLRFKDVFILFHENFGNNCGLLAGLRERNVPVSTINERDVSDVEDVVRATSDVVRVGHWDAVRGLERRVVVYVSRLNYSQEGEPWFSRLRGLSRCTEHLLRVYQPFDFT
ncbi:uncharacterized protein LOC112557462 isoform X2 [Pomacea canaliculata]|nr:uncharacterized protein LOC112557462 isoform X2 [Pomacea canaliculata]